MSLEGREGGREGKEGKMKEGEGGDLLLSYIIVSYIQLSLLEPCSGQRPNFEEASFGWWSM